MMEWNEAQTRCLIDEQLRKAGWEADTVNLRYSKGTRPVKGRNIVISEWPTNSAFSKNGYADYAFFYRRKTGCINGCEESFRRCCLYH